jgi:hypothetical protein
MFPPSCRRESSQLHIHRICGRMYQGFPRALARALVAASAIVRLRLASIAEPTLAAFLLQRCGRHRARPSSSPALASADITADQFR